MLSINNLLSTSSYYSLPTTNPVNTATNNTTNTSGSNPSGSTTAATPAYTLSDSLTTLLDGMSTSSSYANSTLNSSLSGLYSASVTMDYATSLSSKQFQYSQKLNSPTDNSYATQTYNSQSAAISTLLNDNTQTNYSPNGASTDLAVLLGSTVDVHA